MRQTGQVELFKIHSATPWRIPRPAKRSPSPAEPDTAGSIQKYMQKAQMWVWHSALFARHSHNYEKNILKIFANLLSRLWLNDAPSAYSFCNLDLHPITA